MQIERTLGKENLRIFMSEPFAHADEMLNTNASDGFLLRKELMMHSGEELFEEYAERQR